MFFFYWSGDHRDLHVLTHSFPTRRSSDLLSLALVVALAAAPAFAQSTSAGVAGQVLGADGQPVAGADVTITHVESGTTSRVTTDASGRYNARSEEHTSELQSLMRISYAVFCLQKKHVLRLCYNSHQYKCFTYDTHNSDSNQT